MPGLAGLVGIRKDVPDASMETVRKMRDSLRHSPTYHDDAVVKRGWVIGSRTHPAIINPESQPFDHENLTVWFDGELYNAHLFPKGADASNPRSNAEVFARLFCDDNTCQFLASIDGIYSAVVYDSHKEQVHFFTDRYGLQFLYYTLGASGLAWSSEIKAFLSLPDFKKDIDEKALHDFLSCGYIRGNETWFETAKLFPPAAWWTWSTNDKRFTYKRNYWTWSEIKPLIGNIDATELAEELAIRFRKAVEVRSRPSQQIGVLLSGGLDSRAIFASVPECCKLLPTVTFGRAGCEDVRIAAQVAGLRSSSFSFFEINGLNWFRNREECVWWLDGHLSLLHAHYCVHIEETRQQYSIDLSGFLGDATIGGSYLDRDKSQSETELIENRGRRFIGYGLQQERVLGHVRVPFFDNEFLTLAMSTPPQMRRESSIYIKMLLKLMPDVYCQIPWQKTGQKLSAERTTTLPGWAKCRQQVLNHLKRRFERRSDSKEYHDYQSWFASKAGRLLFHRIFERNENCPSILDYSTPFKMALLEKERYTMREAAFLSHAATAELWLKYSHGTPHPCLVEDS